MIFNVLVLSTCLDSGRWSDVGRGAFGSVCCSVCEWKLSWGLGLHPLVSCVHELGRDVGLLFMSPCVYVTTARGQP